jgi:hypothetical protein
MRSRRISLRIPWPLAEALDEICKQDGYENLHACIIGACIFTVQISRIIPRTVHVANSTPKTQDFVLDKWLSFPTDLSGMVNELKKLDRK